MPYNPSAWQDIINKDDLKLATDNFNKHLADENHPYDQIVRYRHKEGHIVWIRCKGTAIRDENGKPVRMLGIHNDITSLKNNEFKYKSSIEGTNLGTWEWNIQTGATVFNERWAEIVGYTLAELAPISIETWMNLAHPDDLEESSKRLNACYEKKQEFYEFEARMKHKNGHWVWVYVHGKVFEWTEDGKPLWMYYTHQDITQRKLKEEKHNRLSERLFIATNTSGIGIWDYDVVNNVLEWDEIMFQIYGVAKGSFSGAYDAWQNGLHPDDRTQAEKDLQMAISGEKEFDTEFRIVWPDQSIHFIKARANVQRDATGNAFRIIGTNWDITNQKLAEAESTESNKRNRFFVEQAPHSIAMLDKNMCYMAASQQWV
ncbi:PAS domain-containing protein, partial [Pseudomonas hunanensis]|uniref:PAS domain-containing protein n=1 Tax=Pseudomonas hunanensis TaxID=1247546 RepID=UPI003D075B35